MTVDAVMARHPTTMRVFNAFGIDSCCGAQRTVRDAAGEDGVDESALLEELSQAIGGQS